MMVMYSCASHLIEISALYERVARVSIRPIAFIDQLSIFLCLIEEGSLIMLFPEKAQIRGEEIGEIASIASQAALTSRRFLVDSSEISAILIGQVATAMEIQVQAGICLCRPRLCCRFSKVYTEFSR
jgi:hypothetical protein